MKLKTTGKSETQVILSVAAETYELASIKKNVLIKLNSPNLKVPGFRGGKAPLNLIEKYIESSVLQQEFLEEAVNELYIKAITEKNLRPVRPPELSLKKFVPFTNLEFEAEVDVVGKITLPDYKKIKKTKTKVVVSTKDVTEVLNTLKTRAADKKDVERAAKAGDQVMIDFKGVDAKGQPVNGAEGKDYPLILGSDTFIPGFEDNVIGVKSGETKTFTLTFPKDYNVKALVGKKVTFTITATKVQEIVEPEMNDEFAAKVGPFQSIAELKEDIKKQLLAEKQQQADQQYESELVEEIVKKTKMTVPSALIEERLDRFEQEEKQNLTYRGQTWQEHLAEEGVREEEHRKRNWPDAEIRVKTGFVLSEIADKEELEVTPEELEVRIQLLKGQYQDAKMRAELDKTESRRDIAGRLLAEKTVEKLTTYANQN